MNPSLNLYPAKIQAQCVCAITQLDEQISALNVLKGSITEFVNDSSIHSVSFDQLKSQCRNYPDVIDAMIYCNEADKADFVTLQGSVGNENLIGADIDKWERYYEQKREEAREKRKMAPLQMAAYFDTLIQMYTELYNLWYAKELAYYEIDGRTSSLFINSFGRQSIQNMIEGLKASFTLNDGYNSSIVAAQAAKIKNIANEAVHMEPEVKAVWDALIKSGIKYEEASIILSNIQLNCPDELNNLKHIISSAGYSTGVTAVDSLPKIHYEIKYQNWLYKINELGQYYKENVKTYCTKETGGTPDDGRMGYSVPIGVLDDVFGGKEVKDDCSSFVYYSLVLSGFMDYTAWPPKAASYLPYSGENVVDSLKEQGFVWLSKEDLTADDLQKGDILVRNGHVEIFDHFDEKGKEWAYSWGEVAPYEPYEKKCNKNNLFNVYRGVWRYEGK